MSCGNTPSSSASSERRILPRKYPPLGKYKILGLASVVLAVALHPHSLWACAACYGQDSGPMARGMNWGIFSLLGIIVFVLGSVAGFFVYLANRSAKLPAAAAAHQLASSTEGI